MNAFKTFTKEQFKELGLPNNGELEIRNDDGEIRLYHMVFQHEGKNYCIEFDSKNCRCVKLVVLYFLGQLSIIFCLSLLLKVENLLTQSILSGCQKQMF